MTYTAGDHHDAEAHHYIDLHAHVSKGGDGAWRDVARTRRECGPVMPRRKNAR
jgi:hypothetical protein